MVGDLPGLVDEALRPRARFIVEVPVEGGGEHQTLRALQPEAVNVGDEDDQAGKLLSTCYAELSRLLHGIDEVTAGVGERDHVGPGGLRLQQEGREIGRIDRVLHGAEHLATGGIDHLAAVGLELRAKGIVSRKEEPGLGAET
ncbi:hypothetical protein ACVW0I_007823 [Bradyrhizobium sp. LM6.11]